MSDINKEETSGDDLASGLLRLVKELDSEGKNGNSERSEVGLDSHFDKDLGIDSLARMELLLRIERELGVSISEEAGVTAETPRDLLSSLGQEQKNKRKLPKQKKEKEIAEKEVTSIPEQAETLLDVLDFHAEKHPDSTHITILENGQNTGSVNYRELYERSAHLASELRKSGIGSGENVAIMLPTGKEFFYTFFGVLMAGGVPVPLYPPANIKQIEDHLQRQSTILKNAESQFLITEERVKTLARLLKSKLPALREIYTAAEILKSREKKERPVSLKPENTGLIQYTSGSTGDPKGVVLSHANLLANVRAMGKKVDASTKDVFVSWLPLYHDMGLIGAWFGSMYYGSRLVVMSPLSFIARPVRWLEALHEYKGTISAAPNFSYEICATRLEDKDLEGLDLSSWRLAFNGAEPVSADTIAKFSNRFEKYGFDSKAMAPVYGLAENSVGVAFPSPGRGPLIEKVKRQELQSSGRAVLADSEEDDIIEVVSSGSALPGHELRVIDKEKGTKLEDRREGRIQFRGPSATKGYYKNPEADKKLFVADWLDTGDNGYLSNGEIFITGRAKDLIIRGGRNIYPQEIEEEVGNIEGVRKGCVAAFSSRNKSKSGGEQYVIVLEVRHPEEINSSDLERKVKRVSNDMVSVTPDNVVIVPPRSVPKTPSGKIRRSATRDLYEKGELGKQRSLWSQFLHIGLSSFGPLAKRAISLVGDFFFGLRFLFLTLIFFPVAWIAVMLIPSQTLRRKTVRTLSRFYLYTAGAMPMVKGLDKLEPKKEAAVLACNHQSYLDSIILTAVLPVQYSFVAKNELNRNPLLSIVLKRLGIVFVERVDVKGGVRDTEKMKAKLIEGHSLLIFPEGTFTESSGVLPFRMGAFVIATDAKRPVVPIAIRGSRKMLRAGNWLPRKAKLQVLIDSPVYPDGDDWEAAVKFRDTVRERVVGLSGEQDLKS